METKLDYELLLDPTSNFKKEILRVPRLRLWDLASPTAAKRYFKFAGKARQGKIVGHYSEAPAVAIIDVDGVLRYIYRGETLGDYPPIDQVIAELQKIQAELS